MSNYIILNYGDSQGEVFDYIFFNNSNYIKYKDNENVGWKSGWSLRGINKENHLNRISKSIETYKDRNIFIFFTFGSVDIEWNLSYKRDILKQNPDVNIFINEMIDSYIFLINKYLKENIYIIICFPFMPIPLSDTYLDEFSKRTNTINYKIISHSERCLLWDKFCDKMTNIINKNYKQVKILDIRNNFKLEGYDKYINLGIEDHHPLLNKTQFLISNLIKKLKFNFNEKIFTLETNEWDKEFMYEHIRRPINNY